MGVEDELKSLGFLLWMGFDRVDSNETSFSFSDVFSYSSSLVIKLACKGYYVVLDLKCYTDSLTKRIKLSFIWSWFGSDKFWHQSSKNPCFIRCHLEVLVRWRKVIPMMPRDIPILAKVNNLHFLQINFHQFAVHWVLKVMFESRQDLKVQKDRWIYSIV